MKHAGKARRAGLKIIFWTALLLVVVFAIAILAVVVGTGLALVWPWLVGLWFIFALFTLYFFRDPSPMVPTGPGFVVSPAHGTVDAIGETTEPGFMGGQCQRISIFLSVLNVHVQNAPVGGKITYYKYSVGQFLSATKAESAEQNENALFGFVNKEDGSKIGLRLIAGVLARRIVPFAVQGDEVVRGERISLIQFGSRSDLYLPMSAKIRVKLGDKVVGGETVMAALD
jgi:phosphatidylserine decarboxylase